MIEATREATPHTMIVALVSFEPVPPPPAPSGMLSTSQLAGSVGQTRARVGYGEAVCSGAEGQDRALEGHSMLLRQQGMLKKQTLR